MNMMSMLRSTKTFAASDESRVRTGLATTEKRLTLSTYAARDGR
jgi:hypothetical protein